jgi:surface protein
LFFLSIFCKTLLDGDISGWNTASVKTMRHMFAGAAKFDSRAGQKMLNMSESLTPY